jgi:hypothetical protein
LNAFNGDSFFHKRACKQDELHVTQQSFPQQKSGRMMTAHSALPRWKAARQSYHAKEHLPNVFEWQIP